jgi:hypothetical protein
MNPLAPTQKPPKRKMVLGRTYNKGTIATNRDQIVNYVKRAEFIFINKQAEYDDGTQTMQITIEIKKSVAEKLNQP